MSHWPQGTVAPLVGAWIETVSRTNIIKLYVVAPLVGAWIETCNFRLQEAADGVAPLVGAWIETICEPLIYGAQLSHLS